MEKKFILAFDQGTTSSRAIIFDKQGRAVSSSSRSHEQIYPNPGWVSQNPNEIYFNVVETGKKAIADARILPEEIAAIGITNQRETVVAWDSATGQPVCDAIVWQCRRSTAICEEIISDCFDGIIRQKTGLIIDPYFSATKIKWILENNETANQLLSQGRLLVGTIDSFLIWNLTSGHHVTDYSNASRTMLFNIHTTQWDDEILEYFKIPRSILPEVVPSSAVVGETIDGIFGCSIPIAGIAGDQHAALFGQTCFDEGDAKNTYGTGCFILQNIGIEPIITDGGLLTTIAWNIGGITTYAVEGSIFNAGSAIQWLMRELQIVNDVDEINMICNQTGDTEGVYMVPAFTGIGAPYWDMYARGIICGMTLLSDRYHIVRATMESIAYQSKDVLDYMQKSTGKKMSRLNVDGGVSNSDFLMQFQADILDIPVERPKNTETTALGAAYLAGLAVGLWDNLGDIKTHREIDRVFQPSMPSNIAQHKYLGWCKAVKRAENWAEHTTEC